jgi:hypothetical protein
MKINRRIKGGWVRNQKNNQKYTCDICGEKLWVAPDGKTVYCNTEADQCTQKLFIKTK